MSRSVRRDRNSPPLTFQPLTPRNWEDLEALFGPRGACGGCWCMFWRLTRSQFERQKGDRNKASLQKLVHSKVPLGILAYAAEQPVAWCAIAPRAVYPALARSRILKPIDGTPVWSITCLFVSKPFRRQGVTPRLLEAAVTYARENGADAVEGYPVEPKKASMPDPFAWIGIASAFRKAGFKEKLRRSETRPIMRYDLSEPKEQR
ncbi:MAG: N-acetyltransferase [Candidatus Manganitrophaceae bacterium]|nr:MAG: N-acetyltransferase [Candidatus Manganitrophaceae bacterium]